MTWTCSIFWIAAVCEKDRVEFNPHPHSEWIWAYAKYFQQYVFRGINYYSPMVPILPQFIWDNPFSLPPILTLTTEDPGPPTHGTLYDYSTLFKAIFSVALLFQTSRAIESCLMHPPHLHVTLYRPPQLIFSAHHHEQASVCGHKGFATTGNGKCKQITNIWLALLPPLALFSQVFLKYLWDFRLKHADCFGPYSGLH